MPRKARKTRTARHRMTQTVKKTGGLPDHTGMIFDGPTAGLDHRIIQAARELFGPAECSHLIDLSSQAACVLQQSYTANSFLFFERLYTAKSTSFSFFWFEKNTEEIGNGLDLLAAGAPMCVGRGDGDPWMHGSRSLTWALIQGGPRVSAAGCFYFHFHFYFPFHVYPQSLAGLFRKKKLYLEAVPNSAATQWWRRNFHACFF